MAWLTGYPREKVQWFPTIDEKICVKCGICMNCGKKVFEWKDSRPKVVNPYSCVVGCTSCGNLCQGRAIEFPDKEALRDLYKREKIWAKVKAQLKDEGKIK